MLSLCYMGFLGLQVMTSSFCIGSPAVSDHKNDFIVLHVGCFIGGSRP